MKYEFLLQGLLNQLRNKIPQNSKLVSKLVDILPLEKMAVYRRLRQEVPFTFEEIVVIAKEFNISLDSMLGVEAKITLPFRVQSVENSETVEIDYLMLDAYLQVIKNIVSDSKGEISLVSNLLPQLLYTGFKYIYQFYYFKWQYYSVPIKQAKSYHEIVFPDRLTQFIEDIFNYSKDLKSVYYILNNGIFQDFINDVNYFNTIRLIKDEDVLHIKEDLFLFLDYMETIATKGFVNDPKNNVYIFISDTKIDTSYYFVDTQTSIRFALIWSFIFNSILVFDEEKIKLVKHRIQSIIRTSTLLSVTGEKQRTMYFDAQRKIVEQL